MGYFRPELNHSHMAFLSFLDCDKSIAKPGYNRWLFPTAALSVHMCIGQAYGLSVFNIPLSKLIGITESAPNDWPLNYYEKKENLQPV